MTRPRLVPAEPVVVTYDNQTPARMAQFKIGQVRINRHIGGVLRHPDRRILRCGVDQVTESRRINLNAVRVFARKPAKPFGNLVVLPMYGFVHHDVGEDDHGVWIKLD